MKMTLRVKCVNPDYNQEYADKNHNGKESDDNIHYLWEDELDLNHPVLVLKVKNNVSYTLSGTIGKNKFSHEIPGCTVLECTHENGSITQLPFSKHLIQKTEKKESKDKSQVWFTVYLKGKFKIVNPFDGGYFSKEVFPFEIEEARAADEEEDDLV
jgi:hypothetical protein